MSKRDRLRIIKEEINSLKGQLFDYKQVCYRLEQQIAGLQSEYQTIDRELAESDGRKKVIESLINNKKKKKPSDSEMVAKLKTMSQDQINKLIEEIGEL